MKVLLLTTISVGVIRFRKKLIESLLKNKHTVFVVCGDEKYKAEIEALGCSFFCADVSNRSINPLSFFSYKKRIRNIVRIVKPDIVFTFQLKPNTFGVLASSSAGTSRIFSMVEGAGEVFSNKGFIWYFVRFFACRLYKKAFKRCEKVFFLNFDDKNEFVGKKLLNEEKCFVIRGIGVDLEYFSPKPLLNRNSFLMIARMIKSKGVLDYCECAKLVKQKYPDATFNYIGSEGDLKCSDLERFFKNGIVNYCGTTDDVRPYLERCTMLVLPSFYREGLPMSIMEAESSSRCVLVYDQIGCRDAVVDNYNGFIVTLKDINALAEKCIYAIENTNKIEEMGKNARQYAEENFDSNTVNHIILDVIKA